MNLCRDFNHPNSWLLITIFKFSGLNLLIKNLIDLLKKDFFPNFPDLSRLNSDGLIQSRASFNSAIKIIFSERTNNHRLVNRLVFTSFKTLYALSHKLIDVINRRRLGCSQSIKSISLAIRVPDTGHLSIHFRLLREYLAGVWLLLILEIPGPLGNQGFLSSLLHRVLFFSFVFKFHPDLFDDLLLESKDI